MPTVVIACEAALGISMKTWACLTVCVLSYVLAWVSVASHLTAEEAQAPPGETARGRQASAAERRRETARLRAAIQSAEGAALAEAIETWRARGDADLPALEGALKQALTADAKKLEKAAAALKNSDSLGEQEAVLAALRSEMLKGIADLAQGSSVDALRAGYQRLAELLRQLNPVYSRRLELARLLGRRSVLLAAWRQTARRPQASFGQAAEERLRARCLAVLGTEECEVPAFGRYEGPLANVWFYRDCRAIEAYNERLAREAELTRGELENVTAVNAYREALGLLPLEIDVRLVKAARGHSGEMARLGYFSHDSPTPGRTSYTDRMRLEGSVGGGGENILRGAQTGHEAFWLWFESPGHHKNMAAADFQSIGVGQHGEHWTQNFGMGERAMLAD